MSHQVLKVSSITPSIPVICWVRPSAANVSYQFKAVPGSIQWRRERIQSNSLTADSWSFVQTWHVFVTKDASDVALFDKQLYLQNRSTTLVTGVWFLLDMKCSWENPITDRREKKSLFLVVSRYIKGYRDIGIKKHLRKSFNFSMFVSPWYKSQHPVTFEFCPGFKCPFLLPMKKSHVPHVQLLVSPTILENYTLWM